MELIVCRPLDDFVFAVAVLEQTIDPFVPARKLRPERRSLRAGTKGSQQITIFLIVNPLTLINF